MRVCSRQVLVDVLMENGVDFDGVIGRIGGRGVWLQLCRCIGRVIRHNTRFCADKRYGGLGSLVKTGDIYNTDFCYGTVPLELTPLTLPPTMPTWQEFYVLSAPTSKAASQFTTNIQ